MESQGILNSQNNIDKELSWRFHTSSFNNLLQSYSKQNSFVMLAQRETDQWNQIESQK